MPISLLKFIKFIISYVQKHFANGSMHYLLFATRRNVNVENFTSGDLLIS